MIIKTGSGIDRKNLENDIYMDNPFEEVMFREDYSKKLIYQKFYGEIEILHFTPQW